MKDIRVKVSRDNSYVTLDKNILGLTNENLQGNIIFELDNFIDGTGYLEVEYNYLHHYEYICNGEESGEYEIKGLNKKFTMPTIEGGDRIVYYPILNKLYLVNDDTEEITLNDGTSANKLNFETIQKMYYELNKEDKLYKLPIYNTLLLEAERIHFQLRIDQGGNLVFKSNKFYLDVSESINAISGVKPKEYPNWIQSINNKLEADNIIAGENITLNKVGKNITINSTGGGESSVNDVKVNNVSVVTNKIANIDLTGKVDKVAGKDLSTNDFTTQLKDKLNGIENGATKVEKTSDITNDSDFITSSYHDNIKQDVTDNTLTTTNKTIPTSINELKGRIDNIQNIGRFLSIWNCTTGLPTSEPSSLPYTYRTGDYYRVGVVDTTTNYMPNGASYTGTASTTQYTGTETLSIGAVFYYDGSVWRLQASGGGGTVQDVQVNGTTILNGGIANIETDNSTITKNANNKLQAVGVVDNKTSNTDKFWTGTLAEYNALATKDNNTFYNITDDNNISNLREKPDVTTDSVSTSYTISTLEGNKVYKLGELTSLTISVCNSFDEESVIYFTSGTEATELILPDDVIQIGDEVEASKSYIIAILNRIAVIKGYEVE